MSTPGLGFTVPPELLDRLRGPPPPALSPPSSFPRQRSCPRHPLPNDRVKQHLDYALYSASTAWSSAVEAHTLDTLDSLLYKLAVADCALALMVDGLVAAGRPPSCIETPSRCSAYADDAIAVADRAARASLTAHAPTTTAPPLSAIQPFIRKALRTAYSIVDLSTLGLTPVTKDQLGRFVVPFRVPQYFLTGEIPDVSEEKYAQLMRKSLPQPALSTSARNVALTDDPDVSVSTNGSSSGNTSALTDGTSADDMDTADTTPLTPVDVAHPHLPPFVSAAPTAMMKKKKVTKPTTTTH